mgnify:CR=1 FL=1
MKLVNANKIRVSLLTKVMGIFAEEDLGVIASNSFNFPIVAEDGEEGWVEIVVKVTKDGGDDGYLKREQYADKEAEAKAKAEEKAKAKAKKIAADEKRRAEKAEGEGNA